MKTRFEEIFDSSAVGCGSGAFDWAELFEKTEAETVPPAAEDVTKTLLIAIDMQQDFMDSGPLGVPGACDDVRRLSRFIYDNAEKISCIAVSIDTHSPFQIFHPAWWADKNGRRPAPYTVITAADVESGKWTPIYMPEKSRKYVHELEKKGKKVLVIWPYHCLQGTAGFALEHEFAKTLYFHSILRQSKPEVILKGLEPCSEMYGMLRPEYDPAYVMNQEFLDKLSRYDRILIAGEAKSHCVQESIQQILEQLLRMGRNADSVYLLEDCMSCIPGFEETCAEAYEGFSAKYGVKRTTTRDIKL